MRVELLDLLDVHQIMHPTVLVSAVLADSTLTLTLSGCAWWQDTNDDLERTIRFIFEGVTDGALDLGLAYPDHDEALETFWVTRADDELPSSRNYHEVFCSAPIPDPFALYMAIEDYLAASHSSTKASDYLNCGSTLRSFVTLARETSFLAGRGPDSMRDIFCSELIRQGVAHNVVTGTVRVDKRLSVIIGENVFWCTAAWAEFADP